MKITLLIFLPFFFNSLREQRDTGVLNIRKKCCYGSQPVNQLHPDTVWKLPLINLPTQVRSTDPDSESNVDDDDNDHAPKTNPTDGVGVGVGITQGFMNNQPRQPAQQHIYRRTPIVKRQRFGRDCAHTHKIRELQAVFDASKFTRRRLELVKEIKTKGTVATAKSPNSNPDNEITLVTQCSVDRLSALEALILAWDGPVSCAVLARNIAAADQVIEAVQAIATTVEASSAQCMVNLAVVVEHGGPVSSAEVLSHKLRHIRT